MSFKIKKWGNWGTIAPTEHYADFAHSVSIGPEREHLGNTFVWRGHVVFCGYEATSKDAIWMHFDPMTNQWHGPYPAPAFVGNYWLWRSAFYGNDREFYYYPDAYVVMGGQQQIEAFRYFYCLDGSFQWVQCLSDIPFPENSTNVRTYLVGGNQCSDSASPCKMMAAVYGLPGVGTIYELWKLSPDGAQLLRSADSKFSWRFSGGQYHYSGSVWDRLCYFTIDGTVGILGDPPWPDSGWNLFLGQPPLQNEYVDSIWLNAEVAVIAQLAEGTLLQITPKLGTPGQYGDPYYVISSDPSSPIPEMSAWEIIRSRERTPWVQLDQSDLDGRSHGGDLPVGLSTPTYHADWHLFVAAVSVGGQVTIYALDPVQPEGRAVTSRRPGTASIGWIGEYAVRENLALDHVLPLPDDRVPAGSNTMPPQEIERGGIVAFKEVYVRQGRKIVHKRNILSDFRSYPYANQNWWLPGSSNGRMGSLFEVFAGNGSIVTGRMPDPMFGGLNPVGLDVRYGLGVPIQDLDAPDSEPTHIFSHSRVVTGTGFASPIVGGITEFRRQLTSCFKSDRCSYVESGQRIQAFPHCRAVVGKIDSKKLTWTTLIDFVAQGSPHLGETDWVVRSVAPIPKCSALPNGGWLVGATLYFAPWEKTAWEWDPGTRDATFRDTGNGWVPAISGFNGPFQTDRHSPVYLTALDEWTVNRSLYGPDALLVYDDAGKFVECLNGKKLYPPNGNEIMVTTHGIPRVIFRIYRHGTYSDSAEGWGQYHRLATDEEIQAPLYACYDLYGTSKKIEPGAGKFRGFIDMYTIGEYSPRPSDWRWTLPPLLYSWADPKLQWDPPGQAYIRAGLGGRQVVPLHPGPISARSGMKGSAHHARA